MNNIKEKYTVIILGGKFSSRISYKILQDYNYTKFIVYDEKLKKKFYDEKYSFINTKTVLLNSIKKTSNKVFFVFATSSMIAKKNWIKDFDIKNKNIINVISKDYVINNAKKIGKGNLIWSKVTLDYDCQIGNFNFINNSSLLLHNVVMGNHNFIGPNTTILGNVKIGNNCYIGSNSVIDSDITIEDNCIIGANAFINKSVLKEQKVFGTPGKVIGKKL